MIRSGQAIRGVGLIDAIPSHSTLHMTLNRTRHKQHKHQSGFLPLTEGGMEQQQTYESGLLHPADNPWVAPGLAQPLSREEGHCNVSAELYLPL